MDENILVRDETSKICKIIEEQANKTCDSAYQTQIEVIKEEIKNMYTENDN